MISRHTKRKVAWLAVCCFLYACSERRDPDEAAPTFSDVAPVLDAACVKCHGGKSPKAGYGVDSYFASIGCTNDGSVAVDPASREAPLLKALERRDHQSLLSEQEEELLTSWVTEGALGSRGTVHPASIMDPRSADWHGTLAARDEWAQLRDADAPQACGRCHAGSPVTPANVRGFVPGATDCTSCHETSAGVLHCATCHGQDTRSYPPRDPCYFEVTLPDAHAAHLEQMHFRGAPLPCTTCHQVPDRSVFVGSHANGKVDLAPDDTVAGANGQYDRNSMTCMVACHTRGGEHEMPGWNERIALDCNSCHLSPPAMHYPGTCNTCHSEMGEARDALTPSKLHLNGKVDLGNGNGSCGSCHGQDRDPWPRDPLHERHQRSTLTTAIACETCHTIPTEVTSLGHLDSKVALAFSGQALSPALSPSFDVASKTCSQVACHAGLDAQAAPRWEGLLEEPARCDSCHGVPPAAPHIQLTTCGGGLCHGSEVTQSSDGYRISPSGRAIHINGKVEVAQ